MGLAVWQIREAARAGRTVCCECGSDCDPRTPMQVQGMHYCDSHKKEYEKHVSYTLRGFTAMTGADKEKGADSNKHKALPVQPTMAFCPSCGTKKLKKDIFLGEKGFACANEQCKLSFEIVAISSGTEQG